MTPCPASERLAAAVTGEAAELAEHVATCAACTSQIAWQRELAALARSLPQSDLTSARRRDLAAEVMALADVPSRHRRQRRGMLVGCAVAVVAAIALLTLAPRSPVTAPRVDASTLERVALDVHATQVARVEPAPPAAIDTVVLRDGELAIDTRAHAPVTVVTGRTRVTFAKSRATVVARDGVIVTAQVFAGTAEVTHDGHRRIVEAGETWTPSSPVLSLDEFRVGYEALRAGKHANAIAAFDRATDPVVAEDAQFWAAIACERAGDLESAKRRLEAFIARFPASPRVDDANAALARVR